MNANPGPLPPSETPPRKSSSWGEGPLPDIAREFQTDARALEDRPLPRLARGTLYTILGLIAAAILWASWAEVDRIVLAEGRIVTAAPLIVVQPLETGTILTLDVRPGDVVRKGQRLATLDSTFAGAALSEVEGRDVQLAAEEARLIADIEGKMFSPSNPGPEERLQQEIARNREAERAARMDRFSAEQTRLESALIAADTQIKALESQIELSRQVEEMRRDLMNKEAGSRLLYLQAQFERVGLENERGRLLAAKGDLAQSLASNTAERAAFAAGWTRESSERLSAVRAERARLSQQRVSAERRSSLVELRSPADAVVLEMARRSVGSVAEQAEPLITLVPQGVPLEAEIEIATQDIGRIRPGQVARLKFESLPFQTYGTATGDIKVVSEDAVQSRAGAEAPPVFLARVEVRLEGLRSVPDSFRLTPGMRVTAEIGIGRRSVMSYLIDPLTKTFDEALREP